MKSFMLVTLMLPFILAEAEAGLCSDGSQTNANGCCANTGTCPSSCGTKSTSTFNGVKKCTCSKCGGVEPASCGDGEGVGANGCCSDDRCPADCAMKQVTRTNNATTCSCTGCGGDLGGDLVSASYTLQHGVALCFLIATPLLL